MGPVIVILIRLLVPFSILKSPFWGTVISALTDAADVILITAINSGDFASYHNTDKVLDLYYLAFVFYVSLSWKNVLARRASIALFVYRLIGVVLFEMSGVRALLLIFPNLFEHFAVFYLGYLRFFKKDPIKNIRSLAVILLVLLLLKMPQEYVLHYQQAQPWNWVKQNVLGL